MKIINNKAHGVLDYVTVIAFALIPTVFGLAGVPAYLSYALAVVHFLMTIMTNFEFGLVKAIPLKLHKWVEMAVGPVLLVISWVLGFSDDIKARSIFMAAGVVIILVGQLSEYKNPYYK
jgi:hypothetical protein